MGRRKLNIQQVPTRTDAGRQIRQAFADDKGAFILNYVASNITPRGRENLWQPGEWAYFSNLPGTVRIKEVFIPFYARALYLVTFQGREYWAFHSELE